MNRGKVTAITGSAVAATVAIVIACGTTSHIYPARAFDRTRGCLYSISSVDIVDGDDPGSLCPIVCLISPPTETGDTTLYVSSECDPQPPLFDLSGKDPDCPRAIAAYTNGPSCLIDGGVGEGGPPDAGPDATDAPVDTAAPVDSATPIDADDGSAEIDSGPDANDSGIHDAKAG